MRSREITPLHIQLMLHYYAIAAPYAEHDPAHANSVATRDYTDELIMWDCIAKDNNSPSGYRATNKGHAWVDRLCNCLP